MRKAACPGTYDPVTNGHIDIFRRAAALFDELVICVTENRSKNCLFTPEKRAELLKRVLKDIPNVSVDIAGGLIAEYAKNNGISVIVKGLRNADDFESEYRMSIYNRRLEPGVETIYLPADENHIFLSSSAVRELAYFGSDISEYVPEEIINDITDAMKDKRRGC